MVAISCTNHDTYAENSQFIKYLIGIMMVSQDLDPTLIDTKASLCLNSSLSTLDFL